MLSARVGTGRRVPPRPSRNPGPQNLRDVVPLGPEHGAGGHVGHVEHQEVQSPGLAGWSTRRTAASASWATAARSNAYAGMRRALASVSDTSALVHTYYSPCARV